METAERKWRDPDTKAIRVARQVLETEQPEFLILFGSRARGEHHEDSDIDIMLVTESAPHEETEEPCLGISEGRSLKPGTAATLRAEQSALEIYGRPVEAQLVWITPEEYRQNRAYRNSLESVAVSEGVVMPRNPENYSRKDYEDDDTGRDHDWRRYDERMEDALGYIEGLANSPNLKNPERDRWVGLNCQRAAEHAAKALLEAWQGVEGKHERNAYAENHNIDTLIGQIRRADPEMSGFKLQVETEILKGYSGRRGYTGREDRLMITLQERGPEKVMEDAVRLLERAGEVRAMAGDQ